MIRGGEARSRQRRIASSFLLLFSSFCAFLIACQPTEEELDVDRLFQEADQLIGERRFLEGLDRMRLAVEAHPEDASIQTRYGQALMTAGQPSLAVWPLSRAVRDPAHLVSAGLLLARAQMWGGSGIDAVKTATRVLEAEPENEAALLVRIEAHLGESLETRALEDLDRLDAITANPTQAAILRLEALLGLGREEEASQLLTDLTERAESMRDEDPASAARLCAATATFTYERGEIEEAKGRFENCFEEHGTNHGVLASAAIDFFDANDERDRATAIFRRRFEDNPNRLDLRVRYADRLQQVGESEQAEVLLLEAAETQPRAWAALADLYAIDGKVAQAVDALDRVIEANPARREDWLFSRADFLLAMGETEKAEAALASLELPAHRALIAGRIAAARGELETAARELEEGIRLWPDNPDARYVAAQVYERMGSWRQAAAHYREAARMQDPHYPSSIALAELQSALGDTEGVQFLLARLSGTRPNDVRILRRLLDFAWDTGSVEMGGRLLARLSHMPGQAAHAAALVARRIEAAEGPEKALETLGRVNLDILVPRNFEALAVRVDLLLALDRPGEAMVLVESAVGRAKDSADLEFLRGKVHRAAGELDAAAAALREARRLDASHLDALLALAELEAARGKKPEARALYNEAIPIERAATKDPGERNEARASIALARLELGAGEVAAARERLRGVLDENPRQGEAAWMLFESYDEGKGLSREEQSDLALRASVFARNGKAREVWERLNAKQT